MTTPQPDTALPTLKRTDELERTMRLAPGQLVPSPTNPRKHFDPERVAQIAESMQQVGQISPIRARSNPAHKPGDGRPPYEIVVGETRWRAAQLAGLPALDVILREYSDLEVIEVQLVENLQRTDLHPMEEAEGYEALLRKPDGLQGFGTVEEIAARVGKSPSYVYQRLKLLALCPAGREAFYSGKLSASVALLIARMPDQAEQARATARVVAGWGGEPFSFRQAAEFLQKEFMLRLSLARFDIAATYAVAGPCSACTKRSGAAPDLFADVTSGDMCLDARCYQAKAEEAHQLLLSAAREAGRTVLQGADARRVLATPGAVPVGHFRLDEPCPALTDSGRTLRAILGPALHMPKNKRQLVVLDLPDAAPVELVTEALARSALKDRGLLRQQTSQGKKAATVPPSPTGSSKDTPGERGAQARGEAGGGGEGQGKAKPLTEAQKRRTEDELLRMHAHKAQQLFPQLLFRALCDGVAVRPELPLLGLQLVIRLLLWDVDEDGHQLLYRQFGWAAAEDDDAVPPDGFYKDVWRRLQDADGRTLGELLLAVAALTELDRPTGPGPLRDRAESVALALAEEFGIDLDGVWSAARAQAHAIVWPGEWGEGSAAGSARRELTPTEAFTQQHGGAASGPAITTEAGNGQQDQTDEGSSDADA